MVSWRGVTATLARPAVDDLPVAQPGEPAVSGRRFISVDALRGFDMFWIIGGDYLVRSLPKIHDSAATRWLAGQMEHCEWAGCHFYDLIFPLFVWIVGVAIPFSLPKLIEREGYAAAVRRIVVRSVVLFLLGVFYMGGVANGFKNVYLAGVLHRIAVAYFFAALLFCFCPPRTLAVWAVVLLVGYWALLTFVPVPGIGPASYAQGKNLAYYIDQHWLPGRKFEGTLLSTMAAVANCLLGIFAGLLLKDARRSEREKVAWLAGAGLISLVVGLLWARQFPIVKLLWTSSYVLVACGISAILLAVFHQVTEVWRRRTWCQPLVWIGMNAITIYLVSAVANFRRLAERFVGGDVAVWLGKYGDLTKAVVALAMALTVVHFLYRRKIFLRL
jgi:predicted acyltransferase